MSLPPPSRPVPALAWRGGRLVPSERQVPEECPVALSYDRVTHAVMLATPADLEDFALGFSRAEGIVDRADEIAAIEIVHHAAGIELRMDLKRAPGEAFQQRRRAIAGPTGCGLCGLDSLTEAVRAPPPVTGTVTVDPLTIAAALKSLPAAQTLNRATRAVHAAGFYVPGEGLVALREDVGRHNALDKLAGALLRMDRAGGAGIVLLTSRVSVEMVQKTARLGAGILVAVSAPTALALRTAEAAGITLIGIARDDGFEIFTHGDRIHRPSIGHVA